MADNIEHQDKGELVANCDQFNSLKHSTVRSYAFTEQGVAMLSTVLRSETVIRISIRIMDAFVAIRRFMVTNAEAFQRLSTMEYHQVEMQQHWGKGSKFLSQFTENVGDLNSGDFTNSLIWAGKYSNMKINRN